MFLEQVWWALAVTPRAERCALAATVWRGFAAGVLQDGEAQALAEGNCGAEGVLPAIAQSRRSIRAGSRPRLSESVERRRRWVSSGCLPPQLACRFTPGEAAVLAVVAAQAAKHGQCDLALDHIPALAGVGRTTVPNSLAEARRLGLLTV